GRRRAGLAGLTHYDWRTATGRSNTMSSIASRRGGPATRPGHPAPSHFVGRPRYGELAIRFGLRVAAGISIVTTIGILVALLIPSIGFFTEVPLFEFLFGTRWAPRFADASFGVIPLITATFWTTAIALTVAV